MVRHISGDLLTVYDVKQQQMIKNMFRSLSSQSHISYSVQFIQHTPKKQHIAYQPCIVLFILFEIPVWLFKSAENNH